MSTTLAHFALDVALTFEHSKHLRDRSAGRWCEVCGYRTDHHTDRHDDSLNVPGHEPSSATFTDAAHHFIAEARAFVNQAVGDDLDANDMALAYAAIELEYLLTGPESDAADAKVDDSVMRLANLVTDMLAEDDQEDPLVRADKVTVGMLLDLEGDKYADPDGTGERPDGAGGIHYTAFEFELAEVERVVQESRNTVVLHTTLGSFGFPVAHGLKATAPDAQGEESGPVETVTVAVEVPAVWATLLLHDEYADGKDAAGQPLIFAPEATEVADDDPRPWNEDFRTVVGHGGDLSFFLDLATGPTNAYLAASMVDGPGRLIVESNSAVAHSIPDLVATFEKEAAEAGRPVRLDVEVVWPSPAARSTAIDAVKRLTGVSKAVAARFVDTGRHDLLGENPALFFLEAEEVLGAVAATAGHVSAPLVAGLLSRMDAARAVDAEPLYDDRAYFAWTVRTTAFPETGKVVLLDPTNWSQVAIRDDRRDAEFIDVPTGLPADGGPNPVSTAKKVLRAIQQG